MRSLSRRPLPRRPLAIALLACLACGAEGASAGPAFPARKPGLWEMRASQQARAAPDMVVQQCADAATDQALQEYGLSQPKMNRKFCKEEMRNEAGKMLVHTEVCKRSDTTMTRRTVMSGDFNAAYRVQSHTVYEPPLKTPPRDEDMVAEMRWLGACPAGMKPGDMALPGGMKMNVADMTRLGAMGSQMRRNATDPGRPARPGEVTLPDGTRIDVEAMQRMAAEMQKAMPPAARGK